MRFRYNAKSRRGEAVRGVIEARSEREAAERLRRGGLTPLDIAPSPERGILRIIPSVFTYGRRVKLAEKALFFRELAAMTQSGVPVASSLRTLASQKRGSRFDSVVASIYADVSAGSPIAAAFSAHAWCFDPITAAMIRAGEESGTLDDSLTKIAAFLEAREELRKKLISSIAYPALVLFVAAVSLCVMTAVVIPQFEQAFRSIGVALPPLTRAVFCVGAWMEANWYTPLLAAAALTLGAKIALRSERFRTAADYAVLKIPVFGDMFLKGALSRSFGTMSVLLRAGIPMLEALSLAASAAGNEKIRTAFEKARSGASMGKSLSSALEEQDVFPLMIVQMASVGEESGRADEMFAKIAEWYGSELAELVKRLSSILEPLMVAVVGAIVGVMAVAVFMPVASAINSFL